MNVERTYKYNTITNENTSKYIYLEAKYISILRILAEVSLRNYNNKIFN